MGNDYSSCCCRPTCSMICWKMSGAGLTVFQFSLLFFLCFTTSCVSSSNSTKTLVYNLTLCELNVSVVQDKFEYIVETYVIFPALTHFLSMRFLTLSHFCDTLVLSTVAGLGFWQGSTTLSVIYACAAFVGLVFFTSHAVRNCMSWRYSCTNRTNYILDTKGKVHPHRSPVVVVKDGRAVTPSGSVDIKAVVLDGNKATHQSTTIAEQWQAK